MSTIDFAAQLKQIYRREERAGLRVAMLGRLVALSIIGLFFVFSRDYPRNFILVGVVLLFALNSLFLLFLLHSKYEQPWFKYLFASIDGVLIATVFFSSDLSNIAEDLPPSLVFRFDNFPFFFVLIAASAFAYSPYLVLWTGVVCAVVWLGGFVWIVSDMEKTLTWEDIPPNPTAQEYLAVFLDPSFVGSGSRVQETVLILVASGLLALAVHRARLVVRRQARAEQEREQLSRTFGRYVPPAVAQALIADQGVLAPVHKTASVLFVDIAGFTTIAESMRPTEVVAMMNAYFDAAAEAIARHEGVITQFMGDAILATFNVPVSDPEHAKHAISAGIDILKTVDQETFAGLSLQVRIGIATGELLAGSVGSAGRQNYTVYGDTVNLAARLEALNKEYQTRILFTEATAQAAGGGAEFREIGIATVRGKTQTVRLFTAELNE